MSTYRVVPLDSSPSRMITTEVSGKQLVFRSYYNPTDQGWFVDILDSQNNPIALGLALVTGIGLIYPHPDLEIGEFAYITTDNLSGEGRIDLGETGFLVNKQD